MPGIFRSRSIRAVLFQDWPSSCEVHTSAGARSSFPVTTATQMKEPSLKTFQRPVWWISNPAGAFTSRSDQVSPPSEELDSLSAWRT